MKKNMLVSDILIILAISTVLAFWFNGLSNPKGISLIREERVLETASDDEFEQLVDTSTVVNAQQQIPVDTLPVKKDTSKQPLPMQQKIGETSKTTIEEQGPVKAKAINYSQVKKLMADPSVMILDARNEHEFAEGHLPNSRNIFALEFEQYIPELIGMNKDIRIIVYCGGGQCELSHELSNNLIGLGFKKIYIYLGGWEDWKKNGMRK
ncbi:MAG: rhodanese-like domain-containing protein [Ignavibacteria bacterium]|nr:rhodanese-like domain-containing protein [Ignavibacteria bacterium]